MLGLHYHKGIDLSKVAENEVPATRINCINMGGIIL